MNISLEQAIKETGAHCLYQKDRNSVSLLGAASDNRLIKEGDLFVCIKGNTVDGHDFAYNALERGAKAILAEHNPFAKEYGENPPIPVLLVENSIKALGRFANARRKAYGKNKEYRVIAITGTAGKTSVKELIAHILSTEPTNMTFNTSLVAKNPLNNNTQIGMPIAILNARGDEKYWVLELGISHSHDMDELGAIIEPDIALILNVGSGHTEGLADKGVAYHKARLLKYVKENGISFVNMDYPELVEEASLYQNKNIRYFSTCQKNKKACVDEHNNLNEQKSIPYASASYMGTCVDTNGNINGQYHIQFPKHAFTLISPFIGTSGAENCLASACVAHALSLPEESIIHACATMSMPTMRFNRSSYKNWDIIDDSYNANPLSSTRMIEAAKELAQDKNFYLLMGEMKELGEKAYEEHVNIGKFIAQKNIDVFFWVGEQKEAILEGLQANSFAGLFIPLSSANTFIPSLKEILIKMETSKSKENRKEKNMEKEYMEKTSILQHNKNLILFKGSRSNYLEHYVTNFKEYCDAL